MNKSVKTGGISVPGIALILPDAHKCVFCWPVSHASITYTPLKRD